MICQVFCNALEGLWRPENRLGRVDEYLSGEEWIAYSRKVKNHRISGEEPHEAEKYVYGHQKDKESLLRSVSENCHFCRFVSAEKRAGEVSRPGNLGYHTVFSVLPNSAGMQVFFDPGELGDPNIVTYRPELVPFDDPPYDQSFNLNISESTGSDQAWSVAKEWFEACISSHDECRDLSAPGGYIPTRVLELTRSGQGLFFRLVNGSQCPPGSRYITLSHCWGEETAKPSLKLLDSTVHHLSEKQPVATLPKTFRDAMAICERFGVRYLWIDRLCIYQDSAEDWRKEASSMQHVYRNGLVSISALGARNSEEGCFFDRDPTKVRPTVVDVSLDVDSNPRRLICRSEEVIGWNHSFLNEPLLQRGWILQERLLAPRVLHFGSKQLFWECRQARCCETHPRGLYFCYDNTVGPQQPHLWKSLVEFSPLFSPKNVLDRIYDDWSLITGIYARCKLTKPSDKLIALSGLAEDMRSKLQTLQPGGDRYLAGLWETKLPHSLSWRFSAPAERPGHYRAPSWSWASLDVQPATRLWTRYAQGVICSISYAETQTVGNGGDTGEVIGGSIVLEGPMATLQCGLTGGYRSGPHDFQVLKISWSGGEETARLINDEAEVFPPHGSMCFDTMNDVRDEVLVLMTATSNAAGLGAAILEGLALLQTEDGAYKRIGSLQYSFGTHAALQNLIDNLPRKKIKII